MARLLIELAGLIIVVVAVGWTVIYLAHRRQVAELDRKQYRTLEEQDRIIAERKARENAAWQAEYDAVRHRIEGEDR